jgi:hypothetical protein
MAVLFFWRNRRGFPPTDYKFIYRKDGCVDPIRSNAAGPARPASTVPGSHAQRAPYIYYSELEGLIKNNTVGLKSIARVQAASCRPKRNETPPPEILAETDRGHISLPPPPYLSTAAAVAGVTRLSFLIAAFFFFFYSPVVVYSKISGTLDPAELTEGWVLALPLAEVVDGNYWERSS